MRTRHSRNLVSRLAGFLALALVLQVLVACSKPAPAKASPILPPPELTVTVATVAMTSGKVEAMADGADWKAVDIGEALPVKSSLRTGPDSSCDLQFGKLGAARIGPSTTVNLKEISLAASRHAVELQLAAGSVASKVTKLASKDSFQVRCRDTVCGVRGTEFLVRASEGKPSVVAVQEGFVAVLPPSFDQAKLEAMATSPAGQALVQAAIAVMLETAPVVEAGQESAVSAAAIEVGSAAVEAITESLGASLAELPPVTAQPEVQVAPAAEAAPSTAPQDKTAVPVVPQLPAELLAALESWKGAQKTAPQPVKAISSESKDALKDLPKPAPVNQPAASPPSLPESGVVPSMPAPEASAPPAALPAKAVTPAAQAAKPAAASPEAAPAPQTAPALATTATPSASSSPAQKPKPEEALATLSLQGSPIAVAIVETKSGLFAADVQGGLLALDAKGAKWQAKTENGANSNSLPVASGSRVFYAGDAKLVALDIISGKKLFGIELGSTDSGLFGRRPLVVGSRLYLSSDTGLEIFDATSGTKIGTIALSDGSDMTPALLPGQTETAAISTRGGSFLIIDLAASKVSQSIQTKANQPLAAAPVFSGNVAIFADRKGLVTCVDLQARKVRWEKSLETGKSVGVYQDPVHATGIVYLFGKSAIYALSVEDGSQVFPAIKPAVGAPLVLDGKLWYANPAGEIIEADASSGKALYSLKAPARIVGGGAAIRDGSGRASDILFPAEGGLVSLDLKLLEEARK